MTDINEVDAQSYIRSVCNDIADFLVGKNQAYGNSALAPSRIFAKSGTKEQIYVRIDDKLNRIKGGQEYVGDDTVTDLLGYLVLLKVYERIESDRENYEAYTEKGLQEGNQEGSQEGCSCQEGDEKGLQESAVETTQIFNISGAQAIASGFFGKFFGGEGPEEAWEGEGGAVKEDGLGDAERAASEVFNEYYRPQHAKDDTPDGNTIL